MTAPQPAGRSSRAANAAFSSSSLEDDAPLDDEEEELLSVSARTADEHTSRKALPCNSLDAQPEARASVQSILVLRDDVLEKPILNKLRDGTVWRRRGQTSSRYISSSHGESFFCDALSPGSPFILPSFFAFVQMPSGPR